MGRGGGGWWARWLARVLWANNAFPTIQQTIGAKFFLTGFSRPQRTRLEFERKYFEADTLFLRACGSIARHVLQQQHNYPTTTTTQQLINQKKTQAPAKPRREPRNGFRVLRWGGHSSELLKKA